MEINIRREAKDCERILELVQGPIYERASNEVTVSLELLLKVVLVKQCGGHLWPKHLYRMANEEEIKIVL